MEEDHEPSSQLTGVVIITLPPPDNPSSGKTITAFTLTDHPRSTPPPRQLPQPQSANSLVHESSPQLVPPNRGPRSLSSFTTFLLPKTILLTVGIALTALCVWAFLSRETLFQLQDELRNDDDDTHKNKSQSTFLFPLYQKPYGGNSDLGDFELKLGRLESLASRPVSNGLDNSLSQGKISAKSTSAASRIDATTVLPVRGNVYPDGLYYTYFHVGNPPRPYFLDVDTGSDLTWIQCDAPCTSCAKGAHPFYKPVKTNIIPPKDTYCVEIQRNAMIKDCDSCNQCDYEIEYADHSSSMGVLTRDELYLKMANASLMKSKVVFGCAYDQQGLLLNALGKTDGILGLSRAKISLPTQLANQGIIQNVVGHCLATNARSGGYLFLGDDFVPYSRMAWVPMLQSHDSNSYQTDMEEVSYGSRQLGLGHVGSGRGRLVFDSGSSYTYFTEQAYDNLIAVLDDISTESFVRDMSDASLPVCWRSKSPLRSVEDASQFFKPLNFQFQSKWWTSIKLQIPPEGYLVTNSKGNVCLGILNGREVHDGSTFILGDVSLRGQLIVYDNVKEKIGWIRSDCVRPQRFDTRSLY